MGRSDGLGVAFALLAGGFWAAYIVSRHGSDKRSAGGQGLAWRMVVSTVLLLPGG